MKLGELRAAIRKTKGAVSIELSPTPNTDLRMNLSLQKTTLLEELERVYGGKKSTETGMEFDADSGFIRPAGSKALSNAPEEDESSASAESTSPSTEPTGADDLLDLDDGGSSATADDDLLV